MVQTMHYQEILKQNQKKKMVDKVIQLKSVNEYLLYCHKFSMVNFYDYFIHHSAYLWKNIFMRKNWNQSAKLLSIYQIELRIDENKSHEK